MQDRNIYVRHKEVLSSPEPLWSLQLEQSDHPEVQACCYREQLLCRELHSLSQSHGPCLAGHPAWATVENQPC